MTNSKILLNLTEQASGKLICPECARHPETLGQELFLLGDSIDLLFCPHCEMQIRFVIVWRDELVSDNKVELPSPLHQPFANPSRDGELMKPHWA